MKLFDFIKDKYERKRYSAKGKDPMTLIYEGKDPEVVEKKKEEVTEEVKEKKIKE